MAQANLIGKSILGYNVVEKLGSGAFGTVYKVIKTNASGQYVRALKHISIPTEKQYYSVLNSMGGDASKADSYFSQMLNNIVSEIRILNDLSEKGVQHIVRYYENDILATDAPKRYDIFILMEYLTPMEDYIQRENFLVRDVVRLGLDVLYGLQSCHDNGVIHRDIKDDNIFVSEKGEYKIGDFGVSKVLKDSSKAESLKGTPNFLAPEVYLGKESYTKSVDLYSLGIVLYRLLNYSRNPFLPHFPEQYFSQDEDRAFEERMSGKIPQSPSLGGEEIGRVIVKAISGSSERFKDADAFINALETAAQNTSTEELNKSVKFGTTSPMYAQTENQQEHYNSTVGETISLFQSKDFPAEERNNSINRHLFESIGEVPTSSFSGVGVGKGTVGRSENEVKTEKPYPSISGPVVEVIPPDVSEPTAIDKKAAGKFVFAIPVIILLAGIITFFIVVPTIYGKTVSFIDWLFSGSQSIVDTLRDSNAVLPKIYGIIGIRVLGWIWLTGLITSLFFVGKKLHAKPDTTATNAILTKKEPYLIIQEVNATIKQLKRQTGNKQLEPVLYTVKRLEEKLAVESAFGEGSVSVINCENEIARYLQAVQDLLPKLYEEKTLPETAQNIDTLCQKCFAKLKLRVELKKK